MMFALREDSSLAEINVMPGKVAVGKLTFTLGLHISFGQDYHSYLMKQRLDR